MKTLVCLHGLGTSSATFDDLKQSAALAGCEFITPDCAGHVRAVNEAYQGDPLVFTAGKISAMIEKLGKSVTLVGHSMGGVLAMLVAEKIPARIAGVISIEGNLISEDCGLISRRIADAADLESVIKLRKEVIATALQFKNAGWEAWTKDIAQVAPGVLKDYASSLVKLSDSGHLLKIFTSLDKPKAYIYGDDYIGHPVIKRLGAVPSHHAPGTGHFIMQDAPEVCGGMIKDVIGAVEKAA
jgi:pimeloyl-ACP methyl ester carboxylesterase